jgi:hypothetical protein
MRPCNPSSLSGLDRRRLLSGAAVLGLGALAAPAVARQSDESKVILVGFNVLRPSQGAVGMREVAVKTADVLERAGKPDKLQRFLMKEALPVVKGPTGGLHLIDHHHLGRALFEAKRVQVHVEPVADLSQLELPAFWAEMDKRSWLHAYDAEGAFVGPEKLPRYIQGMGDDVYRSLAGALRDAGGFAKTDTPFAEFKWADFLRTRVTRSLVVKDFKSAVKQAIGLAGKPEAAGLPGFSGRIKKAA